MKRTSQQRKAIELYCKHLAQALDGSGLDMREAIQVPIRPTQENVKETIWKAVMKALFPGITSTTQLEKSQVSEIYENVNRIVAERFKLHVPFPSEERGSE